MSPRNVYLFRFAVITSLIVAIVYVASISSSPRNKEIGNVRVIETDDVERRVAESNLNWQKGLEDRKRLVQHNAFNDNSPWSYSGGISIWDFFYPNFDCPHSVERIGHSGDGGKWVCGLKHLAKKQEPCVVYSYGVSYETSFEEEIASRTNCSIYLFDHTINVGSIQLPKKFPKRVFIEKIGLGVNDTNTLRSIRSTMKKYNHDFIDILKMDTEGSEFAVFENIQKDFPTALPFGQLQMEIHFPGDGQEDFLTHYLTWLTHLEEMGLRAFRNEINLFNAKLMKNRVPNLSEYSFINVKYDNYLLHSH